MKYTISIKITNNKTGKEENYTSEVDNLINIMNYLYAIYNQLGKKYKIVFNQLPFPSK